MRKNANSPIFKGSSKLSFKLDIKRNIYVYFFCFLYALTFTSCGSKKKIVDKQEKEIKLDSVASSIKTIDLNKFINQVKFIPVDIDKPIIINRDTIYNTQIEFIEKTIDSVVYIKDTVAVEKQIKEKSKQIDLEKEGFNWKGLNWALFLIIIILAAVLGLRYFPKK